MMSRFLRTIPAGVVSRLMDGSTIENTTLTEKMKETVSAAYNQGKNGNGVIVNKLDKKIQSSWYKLTK